MTTMHEDLHPQLHVEEFLDGNSRIELARWQPDESRAFDPEHNRPAALQMINHLYEKTGFRPSSGADGKDTTQEAIMIVADEKSVLMVEVPLGAEDWLKARARVFQGGRGDYTSLSTMSGRYLASTGSLEYDTQATIVFGYKTTLHESEQVDLPYVANSEPTPLRDLYKALTNAAARKRGGGLLGMLRR